MDYQTLKKLFLDDMSSDVVVEGTRRPRVRTLQQWKQFVPTDENYQLDLTKRIFVWSDLHIYHANVIKYCNRPFVDVIKMNNALLANYNEVVSDDDICVWVGDIGFKGTTFINEWLDQCKGHKILVVGNHDFNKGKVRDLNVEQKLLFLTCLYDNINLIFTHYPFINLPKGYISIHGHTHTFNLPSTRHINVSVEQLNYRPVELKTLL